MSRDLHLALRQLRRAPVFAAVVVLTLALGIGANTAIFSVLNAVVLRGLPVGRPDRLFYLHTSDFPGGQTGYGDTSLTQPIFEQLRRQTSVFSDLVAYVPLAGSGGKVAARFGNSPETVQADMVSGNFFTGLRVRLARGRGFTPDDERGHAAVAVISDAFFASRFARDPSTLGRIFTLEGVPFTVIGMTAPGFEGVERGTATQLWIPFQDRPELKPWGSAHSDFYRDTSWWFLMEIGRLAPGISPARAVAQLQPLFARAGLMDQAAQQAGRRPPQLSLTPARGLDGLNQDYRQPLTALMVMVGLILVIACANVALLFVARNVARQREFSLRLALGAPQSRLFRQLLAESLLLTGTGALLAWFFALWATRALAAWAQLPLSLGPDRSVLLFTLAITLVAVLVFSMAPLRGLARLSPGLALRSSASTSQDRGQLRTGQWVATLQIALGLALVVGGVLLARTLRNLRSVPLGLHAPGLIVFGLNPQLPPSLASADADAARVQFFQAVLVRMRALPGIESATLLQNRIGSGWSNNNSVLVDGVSPLGKQSASVRSNDVGPDFFHVLGVPMLAGRDFTDRDTATAPLVAIVNQTFVDRYFHGGLALGHQISGFGERAAPRTIVGVATDSKYTAVDETPMPMAYYPYTQIGVTALQVELRAVGPPGAAWPEVREALRDLAPNLPLLNPMTQQAQFDLSLAQQVLIARLALFFALLAMLLVATGVYGTLAYKVGRRTGEIGVRMALGARPAQILWMILRESLVFGLAGVLLGLPLALAGARLLRTSLYGVAPFDRLSFALAAVGLLAVALAASLLPASRAARTNPLAALRAD